MNEAAALSIENLEYYYRSHWTFKKFQGLQKLSLQVQPGESFGFLGHNGAGKTTTIKCLLGLLRVSRGSIKIFGHDHQAGAAKQLVGYLPEQPYFYDHLSVKEIMELYAVLAGVPADRRAQAVSQALEMVRIDHESRSPMRALSKGQIQRVAMAQAIVAEPRLLVLDEPFSGLDPLGRREFAELLLSFKNRGTTIFMSSHILSDVEFLCDRASIMVQGRLLGVLDLQNITEFSEGTFEIVLRDYAAIAGELAAEAQQVAVDERFLRLTFSEREQAEAALRRVLAAGAHLESYRFTHEKLEDIFVRLVQSAESAAFVAKEE